MKKKYMLYLFGLLLVLLYLDRCTTVNIFPTSYMMMNKASYKYLKDTPASEHYELFRVSKAVYSGLTYDTENNFFLLDEVDGYKKISADGKVELFLQAQLYVPYLNHFGFTDSLVYDFSAKKVVPIPMKEIDSRNTLTEWEDDFEQYYYKADYVFYGEKIDRFDDVSTRESYYPIFLRIDEEWMLLKTPENISINDLKRIGFTPKVGLQMIFLKDQTKHVYSNWNTSHQREKRILNGKEWEIGQKEAPFMSEVYKPFKIRTIGTKKEYDNGWTYYIHIPSYITTGYYSIKKENEVILFKEAGTQNMTGSNSYLYFFTVPKRYEAQCSVSFMKYKFTSNAIPEGRKGLFVLRRKPELGQ